MGATASENLRLRGGPIGWPLQSLWVGGELLGPAESVEDVDVVLLLDLPADELPWLALHPEAEWVSHALGLGERPVLWCYRPGVWPPWNARRPRVARFWGEDDGTDDEVLECLRQRREPATVEPSLEDRHGQLREERALARRHLDQVLDRYHDRDWRREQKGLGDGPDDHLWRAAQGLREIDDALES
jgi:hypothetical protein